MFEERGLNDAIKAFLESPECNAIIYESVNKLLELYEEVKQKAPQLYANKIAAQIQAYKNGGDAIFADDVKTNFKLNFYQENTINAAVTSERVIENLTANKYENACKYVQEICDEMIKFIPQIFFRSIMISTIPEAIEEGSINVFVGVLNSKGEIEISPLDMGSGSNEGCDKAGTDGGEEVPKVD